MWVVILDFYASICWGFLRSFPLTSQRVQERSEMNWLISEQGLLAMCFLAIIEFYVLVLWKLISPCVKRPLRQSTRFVFASHHGSPCLSPTGAISLSLIGLPGELVWGAHPCETRGPLIPRLRDLLVLNLPGLMILSPPVIRCVHVCRTASSQYRLLLFNDSPWTLSGS